MKPKLIIITLLFLLSTIHAEAQFLEKLKEQVLGTESNEGKNNNEAKNINTDVKKEFYNNDVVLKIYDKGQHTTTYYFDTEEIAMRAEMEIEQKEPMFYDSEGNQTVFNEIDRRYEKTSLFKSPAMSMMISTQMLALYKLPATPFQNALDSLNKKGINVGTFNVMAFTFIYKTEHFEENPEYIKSTDSNTITYNSNDKEYEGSYIMFDTSGRLREIFSKVNNANMQGTSKLVYSYKPTTVSIPNAKEIKMPGQDILNIGLDPDKN